jgi:transcriptional regulator with XRE-family HTH domain
MEYYYISLPDIIIDGTKHTLYTRIVNALYYINNNITKQQVLSYLFYVNNRALPAMDSKYLYNFISRLCDNIENTGEIKIKPRIKRIHFNKESNLTKNQKQIMAAKINGTLRTNRTREIIQNSKYELGIRNMKITQKEVAQHTGLSIATVKRNWTSEKKEIKIDTPQIENDESKDIKLPEINENDFFKETETEIIRYKGFKDVEIEKTTPEDKKLFISKINELKEVGLEPSEDILIRLELFSKEKTWYIYDKWIKNQQIKNLI